MIPGSTGVSAQTPGSDSLLYKILAGHSPLFDSVLARKNDWNVQIIYTQINRDKKGRPRFTDHTFNVDNNRYFYPASTVKLPVAILALQKLHELKIAGLDMNSTMITGANGDRQTEVCNDPTAPDGRPTIAHYIKKILLVSDNDAFNRLYEFLGQEYINTTLQKMGYMEAQLIHRLNISLTEAENRHTNPVWFIDSGGRVLYHKPPETSRLVYATRDTKMGTGYMKGDQLVNEPFDFSRKNRIYLRSLHSIVKSVLFPRSVPEQQRFGLTEEDYRFLRRYMSMRPGESKWPVYDTVEYPDNYVKFLYYGAEKIKPDSGLRIFNKTGDAYGFMIDAAYFAGFEHPTEFILSAVIHCNSDGIFNDDRYDYNTIGLPFMKNLGRVIYDFEKQRVKKYKPDLSSLRFNYTE